jgi:putative membrane-bound dehydrogenase-like protein
MPDGFQIHPDFKLELVASEPLVFDPVDMQFDENGRTFVLEMPGYPSSDTDSRLVELLDTDNDGLYDGRNVLDDKLGVATSFISYKNGFLVAAPPQLLWIVDADGDGKIEKKEKLMGGFSTGNLQHNFNGLTYGLDNWIYAANGGNSGRPFFESTPDSVLDLRNTDFKFHLERNEMARVGESSGGFKITFDTWGNLFETHNLVHSSHLIFEDRYMENVPVSPSHALKNISDHEENGTSRIYPIGAQQTRVNHPEQSGYFSGACGITHYGGGAFSDPFNNSLFVADCVLNLIHFDALTENGSTFKTSRMSAKSEFLASSNRSFRPVNMSVGPDGALYVLDMHREVIEHPEWIPDELEAKMDIDAGKDKGRIYRIRPKRGWSQIDKLNFEDPQSLVNALGSENQWARMTAQRLLVTNNRTDVVPELKEKASNSENPLARLHALWTLEGLGHLETSLLKMALEDNVDGVRENAIKIVELRLNKEPALASSLINLLEDSSAKVRMRASLSLGTLNDTNYDFLNDDIAKAAMAMLSKSEHDVWAIQAMASALLRQADSFTLSLLNTKSESLKKADVDLLAILVEKMGSDATTTSIGALLKSANSREVSSAVKFVLVDALAKGSIKRPLPRSNPKKDQVVANALSEMESENDIRLIRVAGNLRKTLSLVSSSKMQKLIGIAAQSVLNTGISVDERLEQLKLLGQDDFRNRVDLLYKLLDNTQPLALQEEALSQLKDAKNVAVGNKLLQLWPNLGPKARKEATDILLYQSQNHNALLTAMEENKVSLGEFNLDLERRRTLLFWSDEDIQKRAQALFSDAGVVKRVDAIAQMRPTLTMKGDVGLGAKVFESQCAQCHRHGDIGKDVGPVLTEVNRKSKESLLYDILDPNAAVDTKYLNHQVKTKDGSIVVGLVFHETDTEIGLKSMGGDERIIPKSEIEQFSSLGTSMMLEGMEANMNHQEMADLLAFLQQ